MWEGKKKSFKALLYIVTFPSKMSKLDKELLWPPQLLLHWNSKPSGLLFSVFNCQVNGQQRVGKISKTLLKNFLFLVVQSLTPGAKEEPVFKGMTQFWVLSCNWASSTSLNYWLILSMDVGKVLNKQMMKLNEEKKGFKYIPCLSDAQDP